MSGAHIDIDVIGLERVERVIGRLIETSQDVDPILRDIGEHLLNSTKDRFATEAAPDGTLWEVLKPDYEEYKREKRPNAGMLVRDNLLRGQLAYVVGGGELTLGTNFPYGARQHFGFHGPDALGRYFDHPARPWLGVSSDDENEIIEIVRQSIACPVRCPSTTAASMSCGVTDHHDAETLSMYGGSCIFSGLAALEQKRPGRAGAIQ